MARYLKLDDLRHLNSPENLAKIFGQLGYNKELSSRNKSETNIRDENY